MHVNSTTVIIACVSCVCVQHLNNNQTSVSCLLTGLRHNFWNDDNTTDLTVVFTLTPAMHSERFFQTLCGLAQDAGTVENVNPLQLLVTFSHYDQRLAIMPRPVWLVISKVWVPLLQLYWHPYYSKYTG